MIEIIIDVSTMDYIIIAAVVNTQITMPGHSHLVMAKPRAPNLPDPGPEPQPRARRTSPAFNDKGPNSKHGHENESLVSS
jgi:hypothetical protein